MTEGELQAAVRAGLAALDNVSEQKMFGGVGYMLGGHLAAGASKRGLLLRIGRDNQARALADYGAEPMRMRGRAMLDYIYLHLETLTDETAQSGLALAIAFVRTLPPKGAKRAARRGAGRSTG